MDDISRLRARPVVPEAVVEPLEEDLEDGSDEGEEPKKDPAVWEKLA